MQNLYPSPTYVTGKESGEQQALKSQDLGEPNIICGFLTVCVGGARALKPHVV